MESLIQLGSNAMSFMQTFSSDQGQAWVPTTDEILRLSQLNTEDIHRYLEENWTVIKQNLNSVANTKVSHALNIIARNSGIPPRIAVHILTYICDKGNTPDQNVVIRKLCETVKYAALNHLEMLNENDPTQNSTFMKIAELLLKSALKTEDSQSQSILLETLGIICPTLQNRDFWDKVQKQLKPLLRNTGTSQKVAQSLLQTIARENREHQLLKRRLSQSDLFKLVERSSKSNKTKGFHQAHGRTYVTMTQNRNMSTAINYRSDKKSVEIMNLCHTFKQKNRRLDNQTTAVEKNVEPEVNHNESGTDLYVFRTTYAEVKNFLEMIKAGQPLKDNDLSVYLPTKFLGSHWYSILSYYRDLVVDVDIAKIFWMVSNNQSLPPEATDKMFPIFKSISSQKEFCCIFNVSGKYHGLTVKNVMDLRLFAIKAVLNQSKRTQNILTDQRMATLRGYLTDHSTFENADWNNWPWSATRPISQEDNQEIKSKLTQVHEILMQVLAIKKSKENDLSRARGALDALFDTESLTQMSSETIQDYCNTIEHQVYDSNVDDVLTDNVKARLCSVVSRGINSTVVEGCLNILWSYLCHHHHGKAELNPGLIQKLTECVTIQNPADYSQSQIHKIVSIILLGLNALRLKAATEETHVVTQLVHNADALLKSLGSKCLIRYPNWDSLVVVALNELFDEVEPSRIKSKIKINKQLMSMLTFQQTARVNSEKQIIFDNKPSNTATSVSWYAANLVHFIVKTPTFIIEEVSAISLDSLLRPLMSKGNGAICSQTKILVSEVLYKFHEQLWNNCCNNVEQMKENLRNVVQIVESNLGIPDVAVYCSVVMAHFAYKFAQKCPPELLAEDKELVFTPTRYFNTDGVTLDEKDFTDELNTKILHVLHLAAEKSVSFPTRVFTIFDIVLGTDGDYLIKVLEILLQISAKNKKELPPSTISQLDTVLEQEDQQLTNITRKIIHSCILNCQIVTSNAIACVASTLHDHQATDLELNEAYEVLEIAFENQELEDVQFDTFIMEKAFGVWGDTPVENLVERVKFLKSKVGGNKARHLTRNNVESIHKILRFHPCLMQHSSSKEHSSTAAAGVNLPILCIELLCTASDNGQNFSDADSILKTITAIVDTLFRRDHNVDLELLQWICRLFLTFQEHNRTIPDQRRVKEILESMLVRVSTAPELLCDILRICRHIVRDEESRDPEFKIKKETLRFMTKRIRNRFSGEICLRNEMPSLLELLSSLSFDSDHDLFTDIVQLYSDTLMAFNNVANRDLLGVRYVMAGTLYLANNYGDKLQISELITKFIYVGEQCDDSSFREEIFKYLQSNQNINSQIPDNQRNQVLKLSQNFQRNPDEIRRVLRNESRNRSPDLQISSQIFKLLPNLLVDESTFCLGKECNGTCLVVTVAPYLNRLIALAGNIVPKEWKQTNISRGLIGSCIQSLKKQCGQEVDINIISVLKYYGELMPLTLHQTEVVILCKHVTSLPEESISKIQYIDFLKLIRGQHQTSIKIDDDGYYSIDICLGLTQDSEERSITDLTKLVEKIVSNRCYKLTIEDAMKAATDAETLLHSDPEDPNNLELISHHATLLSVLVLGGNLKLGLYNNQTFSEIFSKFMMEYAKRFTTGISLHNGQQASQIFNKYCVYGLIVTVNFLLDQLAPTDCLDEDHFRAITSLIPLISLDPVSKFDYMALCVRAAERAATNSMSTSIEEIRTALEQGLKGDNPLVRYICFGAIENVDPAVSEAWKSKCLKKYAKFNISAETPDAFSSLALVNMSTIPVTVTSLRKLLMEQLLEYVQQDKVGAMLFDAQSDVICYSSDPKFCKVLELLTVAYLRGSLTADHVFEILCALDFLNADTALDDLAGVMCPFPSKFNLSISVKAASQLCNDHALPEAVHKAAEEGLQEGISFPILRKVLASISDLDKCTSSSGAEDLQKLFRFIKDHYGQTVDKIMTTPSIQYQSPLHALREFQAVNLFNKSDFNPSVLDNFRNLLTKEFCFDDLIAIITLAKQKNIPADLERLEVNLKSKIVTLDQFFKFLDQFPVNSVADTKQIVTDFQSMLSSKKGAKSGIQDINRRFVQGALYSGSGRTSSPSSNNERVKTLDEITIEFVYEPANCHFLPKLAIMLGCTEGNLEEITTALQNELSNIISIRSRGSGVNNIVDKVFSQWNTEDFKKWAEYLKTNWKKLARDGTQLHECLAVVMEANKKAFGYELTFSQILCCFLAMKLNGNFCNTKLSNALPYNPKAGPSCNADADSNVEDISSGTINGLLQQVVTGGGKSATIRVVAVLKVLAGHKVFVATSNSVLAHRDANTAKKLFRLFSITTDHNKDKGNYISGPKNCYDRDVVFGEGSQFQFDILRHEFGILATMSKISPLESSVTLSNHVMIVDEVDSMFIDDSSKFTRLASDLPGLDLLEPIHHFVWDKLVSFQNHVFTSGDGRAFLALGNLIKCPDGRLVLEVERKNNRMTRGPSDIVRIHDLCDIINNSEESSEYEEIAIEIKGAVPQFIEEYLTLLLEKWLGIQRLHREVAKESPNSEALKKIANLEIPSDFQMKIPQHLNAFVQRQISIWPKSSLVAMFAFREGVNYIVEDERVKPVDFDTSGMIRANQNWGDGVQQFLQLKHNLAVTTETLATNFLSTVSFFRRFDSDKLFGFTGTFGSNAAKNFASQMYNVDCINSPSSHWKNFHQFMDVMTDNEEDWMDRISTSVKLEVLKGRAVLVVCQSIRSAKYVHHRLHKSSAELGLHSLKLYTKNNSGEEKHVERVVCGDVIVATNLAGRGTDIKTCKSLEDNGGLHVCMTFLPQSQRAEDQVVGRTSRNGNYGTAQFILHVDILQLNNLIQQQQYRAFRNEEEQRSLNNFETIHSPVIQLKSSHFQTMCSLLSKLRQKLKDVESTKQKVLSNVPLINRILPPSTFERNVVTAVEEQWALLVKRVEQDLNIQDESASTPLPPSEMILSEVETKFLKFFNTLETNIDHCHKKIDYLILIENPYYATCIGNEGLKNADDTLEKVIPYFEHAIKLEPTLCSGAHAGLATAYVTAEYKWLSWNCYRAEDKIIENYKDKAVAQIKTSLEQLALEQSFVSLEYLMYAERCRDESDFAEVEDGNQTTKDIGGESELGIHLQTKYVVLGNYISSVENMMGVINKSERYVDILVRFNGASSHLTSESHLPIPDHAEHCRIPRNDKSLNEILFGNANYQISSVELTLRDLTRWKDLYTKDQIESVVKYVKTKITGVMNVVMETQARLVVTVHSANLLWELLSEDIWRSNLDKKSCKQALGGDKWYKNLTGWIPYMTNDDLISCTVADEQDTLVAQMKDLSNSDLVKRIEAGNYSDKHKFSLKLNNPNSEHFNETGITVELKNFTNFQALYSYIGESRREDSIFIKAWAKPKRLQEFLELILPFMTTRTSAAEVAIQDEKGFKVYRMNTSGTGPTSCFTHRKGMDDLATMLREDDVVSFGFFWADADDGCTKSLFEILFTAAGLIFDVEIGSDSNKLSRKEVVQYLQLHTGEAQLEFGGCEWSRLSKIRSIVREAELDVQLRFTDLTPQVANTIALCDSISEEDINTREMNKLSTLYSTGYTPAQVWVVMARGLEYIVVLQEEPPIPVLSVGAVCALGTLQVSLGFVFVATGLGAPLGLSLISEGVVDLIYGARVCTTRQFDLKTFAIQKSISLAVSSCTLGVGAFQNAGKGLQMIGSEVAEQGVVQFLKNGKVVAALAGKCWANIQTLGLKESGIILAEVATRECLYNFNAAASDMVARGLEDSIMSGVATALAKRAKTHSPYHNSNLNRNLSSVLDRLVLLHKYLGMTSPIVKVEAALENILLSTESNWTRQLGAVGLLISQTVGGKGTTQQSVSLIITLGTVIVGSCEIASMLEYICSHLEQKLKSFETQAYKLENVIQAICNLDYGEVHTYQNCRVFANALRKSCPFASSNSVGMPDNPSFFDILMHPNFLQAVESLDVHSLYRITIGDELGIGNICTAKDKLKDFCTSFRLQAIESLKKSESLPFAASHNEIFQRILATVTTQIVKVSKTYMLNPIANQVTNYTVRKMSEHVKRSWIKRNKPDGGNKENEKRDQLWERKAKGQMFTPEEDKILLTGISGDNLHPSVRTVPDGRGRELLSKIWALGTSTLSGGEKEDVTNHDREPPLYHQGFVNVSNTPPTFKKRSTFSLYKWRIMSLVVLILAILYMYFGEDDLSHENVQK